VNDRDSAAWVTRLVLEYSDGAPATRPLNPSLNLKDQLGIDSMSLVSLVVRMSDELGVDVGALEVELGSVNTIGDLVRLARKLTAR
jgi:acyl carrier protein